MEKATVKEAAKKLQLKIRKPRTRKKKRIWVSSKIELCVAAGIFGEDSPPSGILTAIERMQQKAIHENCKKTINELQKKINRMLLLKRNAVGDLRIPKSTLIFTNKETGEVVARDGVWLRAPMENEILKAVYKP